MSVIQYIFIAIMVGMVAYVYFTIPPEPKENVEARKRFGKVSDTDKVIGV